MKKLLALCLLMPLAGCAQWNALSDTEKTAVIVGGAILVGANIIKNSSGDTVNITNQNCVADHPQAVCP